MNITETSPKAISKKPAAKSFPEEYLDAIFPKNIEVTEAVNDIPANTNPKITDESINLFLIRKGM